MRNYFAASVQRVDLNFSLIFTYLLPILYAITLQGNELLMVDFHYFSLESPIVQDSDEFSWIMNHIDFRGRQMTGCSHEV